ncbi:uncharacterized protein LOC141631688 [Silene latifolia]|uniref:uncharacterized protein LOC141631688 n=1 Tax=Silene latifolia TaxID=37657 RepID=UPI003D770FBF
MAQEIGQPRKHPSRWCDFHQDIGHTTEECIQLRKQVAYLLKRGYLKDLIQQPRGNDEGAAAKIVARESKLQLPSRSKLLPVVTFDDSDLQGVSDLHHDSLVITMQMGTAKVSRILIDGGSSINLVMMDVLKAMKIDEEKIIKKSSVLVRFSIETKNTLEKLTCQLT